MRPLLLLELIFGWLSVLIGAAVLIFTYAGGYIAPESVQQDVIGFSIILAVLAVGVTLDYFFSSLATRVLLAIGVLAMLATAVISFVSFLLPAGFFAVAAVVIAFVRQNPGWLGQS
ncbi:MAG TPA: hypothetical protein VJO13_06775 [Ktedonobacterales bacterium]|nr:hypothetical protein [Ktedonobacterales bacterium]